MIGVFDSGIGGVTVLRELAKSFPNESFIYLGDTARLPYGIKSPQTIRRYCEQNLHFLLQKKVKAIVIACNSASTQVTEDDFAGVPVFNVISPGARQAVIVSATKRIGVLGTKATIFSQAYNQALLKQCPEAFIVSQACPLLVPLAEENWVDDPVTNLIVFRYLQPLLKEQIDTLILGCTHYPILRASLQKAAGLSVRLVDSGSAVAEDLKQAFQQGRIEKSVGPKQQLELYCTDTASGFQLLAEQLLMEDGLRCDQFLLADLNEVR